MLVQGVQLFVLTCLEPMPELTGLSPELLLHNHTSCSFFKEAAPVCEQHEVRLS
jgi:hypothetical protein